MKRVTLLLFLLLIPTVYSLGLASTYLEDNTLKLKPGESFIYTITLQNSEDIDIEAEFTLNSEIAYSINPQDTYLIQGKTYDTKIKLNVTIPDNQDIGKKYNIAYSLKPITTSTGQVTMNFKLNKNFNVEVIGDEPNIVSAVTETPSFNFDLKPLLIIGLIIIVVLSFSLLVKRSSILVHKFDRLEKPKLVPDYMKKKMMKIVKKKEIPSSKEIKKRETLLLRSEKTTEKVQKTLDKRQHKIEDKESELQKKELLIKEKEKRLENTLKHSLKVLEKDQKKEFKDLSKIKDTLDTKKDQLTKKEESLDKKESELLKLKQELTIMQNSLAREKSKQKDTVLEKQETLMTVNKKPEKIFLDNPKDFFHLTSGETIASIQELRSVLDNIDNDTFHHYVNSPKNDFASWIEHIFHL